MTPMTRSEVTVSIGQGQPAMSVKCAMAPESLNGFEQKNLRKYAQWARKPIIFSRSWIQMSRSQKRFPAEAYRSTVRRRLLSSF